MQLLIETEMVIGGHPSLEYLKIANDEVLVAVQIEREEAIENVEEIVSIEGVDATWLGPGDLSASMGLLGQPFHPKVLKAMDAKSSKLLMYEQSVEDQTQSVVTFMGAGFYNV